MSRDTREVCPRDITRNCECRNCCLMQPYGRETGTRSTGIVPMQLWEAA